MTCLAENSGRISQIWLSRAKVETAGIEPAVHSGHLLRARKCPVCRTNTSCSTSPRARSRVTLHARRLAMSRYTTHPRGRKPQPGPLDLLSVAQQVAATTAIVPTDDIQIVNAEPILDRRGRRRSA